jgi:hypothetical protein
MTTPTTPGLTPDTRFAELVGTLPVITADTDIHDRLAGEIAALLRGPDPHHVRITVRDGEVMLTGRVPWRRDIADCHRAAEEVPGVTKVKCRLDYAWDDRFCRLPA